MTRARAAEKYGVPFGEDATVYIADSTRDVEAARDGRGPLPGRGQRPVFGP